MKKYLVFSDIDGTLLDCTRDVLDISEKTRYALAQIKKIGYLVLVTGRPMCLIPDSILSVQPDGFICSNGTYAYANGKEIYHHPFLQQDLIRYKDYCKKSNDSWMFMNQDHCYVKDSKNDPITRDFVISMSKDPDKVLLDEKDLEYSDFVWLKSLSEESRTNIEKEFGEDYQVNRQQETTFDIVMKGVSKDNTIQHFLKEVDFQYEKSICFGDGLNDIGMMKAVDYSFAMGNARELTKQAASEVAKDALEDGFYEALVAHHIIEPLL